MYCQKMFKTRLATEVSKYFTIRCPAPQDFIIRRPAYRKSNINETTERQKLINDRKAMQELRLLIMNNFHPNDAFLGLTYRVKPSVEESKEILEKFRRRLKRFCKKLGIKLKYIIITEYGTKGRLHHHMLCNIPAWVDIEELTTVWGRGDVNHQKYKGRADDADRVADYFIKKKHSAYYTDNNLFKKRYYPSQGLDKPEPSYKEINASAWREDIRVPKGYMLDEDSVLRGFTENEYPYMFYRLIKINPYKEELHEPEQTDCNSQQSRKLGGKVHRKQSKNKTGPAPAS